MRSLKWLLLLLFVWSVCRVDVAYAQIDVKPLQKEVKKEIKRLIKEGWKPAFGASSLCEQVTILMKRRTNCNDDGSPRYLIGRGIAEGRLASADYNLAYRRAEELAWSDLGSQIGTHVSSLTNDVIDGADRSFESTSQTSSHLCLPRDEAEVLTALFRQTPDGRFEVLVYIALSRDSINSTISKQ